MPTAVILIGHALFAPINLWLQLNIPGAVQSLLSVRSLVLPMHQDTHTWLKFASLCRKSGRPKCARH